MQETGANLDQQIEFYQRKYELSPHSRAFAPLADLYRRTGRLDEALEVLHVGLAEHPSYVSALVILGRCHLDAGRGEQAADAFRRVLDLDPDNLVALKQSAGLAEAAGEADRAQTLLARVVVLDPTDEQVAARFEALRAARVEPPAAAEEPPAPVTEPATRLEAAPTPEPVTGEGPADEAQRRSFATRTLAEIYLAQGYRDKALAVLRQILSRHPDRADVAEKIAELEKLPVEAAAGAPTAPPGPSAAPRPADGGSRQHFDSWLQRLAKPEDHS